jgi:hypothetical protein
MKSGSNVNIDANALINFPGECVVCGKKGGLVKRKIICNPSGQFGYWKWLIGKIEKLTLPIHEPCGKQVNLAIVIRSVTLWLVATLVLLLVINLELEKSYGLLLLGLFGLPVILWQTYNPPHIEVREKNSNKIEFFFRERSYAKEFARLNNTEVIE